MKACDLMSSSKTKRQNHYPCFDSDVRFSSKDAFDLGCRPGTCKAGAGDIVEDLV